MPDTTWPEIPITEQEKAAACFFHTLPGVGVKTLQKLQQGLGSLRQVFQANQEQLKPFVRTQKALQSLQGVYKEEAAAWTYYQQLKQQGIGVLLQGDPGYPELLGQIFDPPFILYWKGNLTIASQTALAVVGCRQSTAYGRTQAVQFCENLARIGIVIVSGLALGIDTAAHQGALQAPGGKTIAVLGSGLSMIYPPENRDLAKQIIQNGLIISEFPPLTPPNPRNFPRRNRIISGLSQGVFVIEARKKSGALITADFAMEQGREVYAMPGIVTNACSEGPHRLIQQGAKLVTNIDDILEDYLEIVQQELQELPSRTQPKQIEKKTKPQAPLLSVEEKNILDVLDDKPTSMDEILLRVQMDPGSVMKWLLQMEIQGQILSLPGNCYKKKE